MIPYSLFYEQVRDEMFVCLNKQLKVIALIEKLRQDRLDTHGEKELKRRVQVQQKIVNMKAEENRRRDEGEFSRVIFFMKFFLEKCSKKNTSNIRSFSFFFSLHLFFLFFLCLFVT